MPGWEALESYLARRAGITTPTSTLAKVRGRNVLLSVRFDRDASGARLGYSSALTLLEAIDGDRLSYPDIAEVVSRYSPRPKSDLAELYRRMVFFWY